MDVVVVFAWNVNGDTVNIVGLVVDDCVCSGDAIILGLGGGRFASVHDITGLEKRLPVARGVEAQDEVDLRHRDRVVEAGGLVVESGEGIVLRSFDIKDLVVGPRSRA